jgi:ribonuclease HI
MTSIYTDGSCLGNPGPGGWGMIVVKQSGIITKEGGGTHNTTNNIMEMTAMDAALNYVRVNDGIFNIYTDSKYVKDGITTWIAGWKKKGWKTATGQPVKNKDVWESIDSVYQVVKQRVTISWVKAHNGNEYNEKVDDIARDHARRFESNI